MSIDPLDDLAAAAETHAREEHGVEIGIDGVEAADRVLDVEAVRADAARVESLTACYGAWLGRLAVGRWGARWAGLAEAVAPRLLVAGRPASPMDAVRRRLTDRSTPSLAGIVAVLGSWVEAEAVDVNRAAWDALASDGRFAGVVPSSADPESALDPWLRAEGVRGKDVLCLAAGGGRHGPLLAGCGARVTVVDLSDRQLDHDRRAGLRTVRATMEDLSALGAGGFDVVLQPVSACYVRDVERVYREVARVIRRGGLYVVQHKQPASLQGSEVPASGGGYGVSVPLAEGARLESSPAAHREAGTSEYLHGLDALLGGLCRAGFVIEDVVEPPRGDLLAPADSPAHRAAFLPPYLKLKARRVTKPDGHVS